MYGGINVISADASEKVESIDQLVAFASDGKKSRRGMRGDILEILGIPLEFWSHTDELSAKFGGGEYEHQAALLRGMDGHTGWANRELLKRAGISADYLKKLTADERSYYGEGKDFTPNGFFTVTLWAMHIEKQSRE
jgi:predicted amidohydrolase YtcJ